MGVCRAHNCSSRPGERGWPRKGMTQTRSRNAGEEGETSGTAAAGGHRPGTDNPDDALIAAPPTK